MDQLLGNLKLQSDSQLIDKVSRNEVLYFNTDNSAYSLFRAQEKQVHKQDKDMWVSSRVYERKEELGWKFTMVLRS